MKECSGDANAIAHRFLEVKKYFAKQNVMASEHPPYSLDLPLPNAFLFL
jgi:hypothetical protein